MRQTKEILNLLLLSVSVTFVISSIMSVGIVLLCLTLW